MTVAAAALALGVTGCGSDDAGPNDPTPTGPRPTVSTSTASPPTSGEPTSGTPQRLTGVISRAPEERCTVLATAGSPAAWVLIGAVSSVQDGDRVTVVGREDPGATTRCQQGPVFVVAEVVSD